TQAVALGGTASLRSGPPQKIRKTMRNGYDVSSTDAPVNHKTPSHQQTSRTMHEFSFDLLFAVPCPADPDREHWANHYIEQLGEAGCTDATIGTGRPGFLSLGFDRE